MLKRTLIILMTVGLVAGCETRPCARSSFAGPAESRLLDEQTFARIVAYYHKVFPKAVFGGPSEHEIDGPRRERCHVAVPVAVDAEYRHPFARAFLMRQAEKPDGLAQMIAADLLLLRNERLFTYRGRAGHDKQTTVDCTIYVVKVDPTE
jgi:hypothetical protein